MAPYTDDEKAAKREPLLNMWKVACITNSPHENAEAIETKIEQRFSASLSNKARIKWLDINNRHGTDQSCYRKWDERGKISLVVFFVKLAKAISLSREDIEDNVYYGPNPTFDKKWTHYVEDAAQSDYDYASDA